MDKQWIFIHVHDIVYVVGWETEMCLRIVSWGHVHPETLSLSIKFNKYDISSLKNQPGTIQVKYPRLTSATTEAKLAAVA